MAKEKYTNTELNFEILAEEASEIIEALSRIIRMKSKIIRFGLTDYHPKNNKQNRDALEEEIGHFEAILEILIEQGTLSKNHINKVKQEKYDTLGNYYFPKGHCNIEQLICGLCGKKVLGRQWPNTMKGQSICPSCYKNLKKTCDDLNHLRENYGDEGYHHNIREVICN